MRSFAMIGSATLSRYLATRFLTAFLSIFAIILLLFYIVELVELPRRAEASNMTSLADMMKLALFRLPGLAEQTLPFSILYGSMSAFMSFSRRHELVIVWAAGFSVWQFLRPSLLMTLLIGLVAVTLYNPLATMMTSKFERLEDQLGFRSQGKGLMSLQKQDLWLQQSGKNGPSIIYARQSSDHWLKLYHVMILHYKPGGSFTRWIEAEKAELIKGEWLLSNASVSDPSGGVVFWKTYTVDTHLSPAQVRDSFTTPNSISFWKLPKFIELAENAGLSATRYRLQFQVLLAKPLLMCAMVLIAATFSMRLFRLGNIVQMVLGGIVTGFLLFSANTWAYELGETGIIPVIIAAWSPAIAALLIGTTLLFVQEDG